MGITSPNGGSRQQDPRRPGRVIPFGKYLLLDRIAVGGMAEVYLAKSFGIEGFEKLLAIKRILPTMAEDQDFIEMFIDEAKIAGQLTHANVVPIFELGKIGESHYIAMEYVWGKDLLQIMNRFRRLRKRMPPAMVAWIATKMCEALDYAHNKRDRRGHSLNIIHRDVSPQNILVSYEGEVKLIDFGIAKAASRTTKTQAGVLKGKFGYMSPEQVRGMPIDHRSDIFAVGTCMYEALTSERLFLGESDFSTLEKVRNAAVAPVMEVAEVPGELNEVVMRALRRDPGDRFQTASELHEALQGYLAKQRPPFGTSKLASWLKTAFSGEMTREKAKLDSFANVGRPSVLSGPRKTPASAGPRLGDEPAVTRRPPPPRGPSPAPSVPRTPAVPPNTDELGSAELQEFGDLEGEATMVSDSPFEDAMTGLAGEGGVINDEPTQIFFSADDMEEAKKESEPPRFAGGVPPVRPSSPGAVRATFRPGSGPPVATQRPSVPGAPPMPPSPAVSMGRVPGPAHPAARGAQPRSGPQPLHVASHQAPTEAAPLPTGRQRALPTHEMSPVEGATADAELARIHAQRAQSSSRRTILFAVLGAVAMLALGIVGALLVFGGDDVGTVEIRTTPSVGAAVVIDGTSRGSAPLRIERLPAGPRTIEIRADGYETATRTVMIQKGAVAMLEIALTPAQAPPRVASAAPAAAQNPTEAAEEDSESARGPPADDAEESDRAERNKRTSEQRTEGTRPTKVAQTERAERTRRDTRTPRATERPRTGSGTLVINAIPWARVFIDGRDTGRNTPVPSMRVRSGRRTIGLRTADGQMHDFSVDVPPGETVRLMKRL